MEQYLADMHTHTIASGHAYSTIREMVQAAEEKGLKLLGIIDDIAHLGIRIPGDELILEIRAKLSQCIHFCENSSYSSLVISTLLGFVPSSSPTTPASHS